MEFSLFREITSRFLLTFTLLLSSLSFAADVDDTPPLAPGYGNLDYPAPKPGSYALPAFAKAADATVLDEQGQPVSLHEIFSGKYVLLNFMYSSCSDVNGCPLSAFVFYQLKAAMAKDPVLADKLQLLSLSFDPKRDDPAAMRTYANNFRYAGEKGQWRFLTTADEKQLAPILQAYDQDIQQKLSTDDDATNDFSHVLRVFLIDPQRNIRNIYSVSFLHTDLILSDLNTLLMAETAQTTRIVKSSQIELSLPRPGDDKSTYHLASYKTNSLSLANRQGKAVDLTKFIRQPPLGLPQLDHSNLKISQEKVRLGRQLFFDRRLSLNDTVSCAMCHIPEQGFASNEVATAVGIEGRSVRRNTPSLYNVAYMQRLFHDGRENDLAQQVWGPLLAKNEMGNPSIGYVLDKIKRLPEYKGKFEQAFGRGADMQTVGDAIAAYEMSLNSADSPFDRWYFNKQNDALTAEAKRGFELFTGRAGCNRCHSIDQKSALFTDQQMHNTGVGYLSSVKQSNTHQKVQVAPGVFMQIKQSMIDSVGEKRVADLGLYEITENPEDRWKFKTPSLRNVAMTAPYMHDGSLSSLEAVIDFYAKGGVQNELLSPLMQPLTLSEQDKSDLVSFMRSLSGSNVGALVSDAFAVSVGDLKPSDPHWAHRYNAGR